MFKPWKGQYVLISAVFTQRSKLSCKKSSVKNQHPMLIVQEKASKIALFHRQKTHCGLFVLILLCLAFFFCLIDLLLVCFQFSFLSFCGLLVLFHVLILGDRFWVRKNTEFERERLGTDLEIIGRGRNHYQNIFVWKCTLSQEIITEKSHPQLSTECFVLVSV